MRSIFGCRLATTGLALLAIVAACGPRGDAGREANEIRLLALHERILAAHRTGNVDDWMRLEAADYLSVNGGEISRPSVAERRAARQSYLDSTTFTTYRDLVPPIVRVSEDGRLGWLIAQVEIVGSRRAGGGEATRIDEVWAWVELYEKRGGEWRLTGNVANRRPQRGNDPGG